MILLTIRDQIRKLPGRLEKQWRRADGTWTRIFQKEPDTEKIHAAVAALDPETATRADVVSAMGFEGNWVGLHCHECGKDVDAAVQLGEEPDVESCTAKICLPCLHAAVDMMEALR